MLCLSHSLLAAPAGRIACVRFPRLRVQVARRADPALAERPLLIGVRTVADCSPELRARGVGVGMPLRRAQTLCPDAVVLPDNEGAARDAHARALDLLNGWACAVEDAGLGRAYLDLYGGESDIGWGIRLLDALHAQCGLDGALGIARSKFIARVAAASSGARRVLLVAERGADFLRSYPVAVLPLDAETRRRLHLLGVHSVGAYAALPRPAVLDQFGAAAQRAHRLAHGQDRRAVAPCAMPALESAEQSFDPALDDARAFERACRRLLEQLSARLRASGRMCRALRLALSLDRGGLRTREAEWRFREPTASVERLLAPLVAFAASGDFAGEVAGVRLSLAQVGAQSGRQLAFLLDEGAHDRKLRQAVRQLQARYGAERFARALLLDADAPGVGSAQRFAFAPLEVSDD